jgi:uncharacterized protein (TIGR03000 family)
MYSVVLAAMLTAGAPSAPAFGCHGCHGCCGGCYGCHGCSGCHGCCGGCYGCYGCCGGCYGCCGGCYGCCGGCSGYYSSCSGCCGGCSGCYGCCGGCYGSYSSCYGCCGGCYGCAGCYGVVAYQPVSAAPVMYATTAPAPKTALATQATVVVKLPGDATLFVDGERANLTSETRSFVTPALEADRDYVYTMKVEATRNGEVVSRTERVLVHAGRTTRVDFGDLNAKAVAKSAQDAVEAPARITVKLPADARLFVDDVACPLTSTERTFETPRLEAGRRYFYNMRAEVVREGQTRTQTKRVEVLAGLPVSVNFSDLGAVQAASR